MIHTFRAATADDIDTLVDLDYELFPENNFNEKTLLRQLEEGFGYLVYVDDTVAGYTLCSKSSVELIDIMRLGVRAPYRSVGIGTVLLQNILALGKETMLTVRKENIPAINLYRKHGFEITGIMPQHESLIMRRQPMTTSS